LQARGSLQELIDDLNACDDENYLPPSDIAGLKQQSWQVYQLVSGYIRYLRERKAGGATLALHESAPACDLTDDEMDAALDEPIQQFHNSTI
jgi:hypothetical protein